MQSKLSRSNVQKREQTQPVNEEAPRRSRLRLCAPAGACFTAVLRILCGVSGTFQGGFLLMKKPLRDCASRYTNWRTALIDLKIQPRPKTRAEGSPRCVAFRGYGNLSGEDIVGQYQAVFQGESCKNLHDEEEIGCLAAILWKTRQIPGRNGVRAGRTGRNPCGACLPGAKRKGISGRCRGPNGCAVRCER